MRNLFLRLYLLVVLTFIGVGWSLDKLFDAYNTTQMEDVSSTPYEKVLHLVEYQLSTLPVSQWQSYLNTTAEETLENLQLEQLDDVQLDIETQKALMSGKIIILVSAEGENYIKQIRNSAQMINLGPIKRLESGSQFELFFALIFYLILAAVLLLWIWPLWRSVKILNLAASQFGEGSLETRVQVSNTSSLSMLANTFNNMADRIQTLIKTQNELTNAVSHELRTPISRLKFSLEMLYSSENEGDKLRYLKGMGKDVNELEELTREMLAYARLEQVHAEPKTLEIKIVHWLNDVVDEIKQDFPALNFTVNSEVIDKDCNVAIEPHSMARALSNLLRNAARYSKNEISVTFKDRDKVNVIWIDDDGQGIAENDRKKVFEAFTRLDNSRDRSSGGVGLGLAIVKRIMEWHQGKVSIVESPLGGARFILEWPK